MDFGKFKYETSKKEKASRKHQSTIVLKEIKLRPKTDEHDLDFKVKHIRTFLSEGNKCKLVIVFRGREIVHPETGQAMLDRVVKTVADIAMVEQRPMMEGRRMVMIIGPRVGVIRPPVGGPGGRAPARRASGGGPSGTSPPAPAAAKSGAGPSGTSPPAPAAAKSAAAPSGTAPPAPAAAKRAAASARRVPAAAKTSAWRRRAQRRIAVPASASWRLVFSVLALDWRRDMRRAAALVLLSVVRRARRRRLPHATGASAATTARASRPAPARRSATACAAPARLTRQRSLTGASAIGGPKARGATDDILLENDRRARGAGRARRIRRAWRRRAARSSTSRRSASDAAATRSTRSTRRPACSRATPSTTRATPSRSIGGTGGRGLRRRRVPRPPGGRTRGSRSSPATSCAPASRACACAPTSTTARANRTRCTSPTDCSGATTTLLPFVPGTGLGFRAPELNLRDVGERLARVAVRRRAHAGAARRLVRGRSLRSPDGGGLQQPDADRVRRSAGDDAARRRHPSRTLHPRRAGARAGARRRRGAARPRDGSRRAGAGDRDGPGRRGRDGRSTARLGTGGVAAVLRAGVRPRPRRPGAPQAVDGGGPGRRRALPRRAAARTAATACSRTRSGCRPRPRRSFAVEQADVDLGDITVPASAHLMATVTTAPGQPPQTTTFAELVLVPVEPPRGRRAGPQPLRPVPGLRSDAGTAARRLARRATARSPSNGQLRPAGPARPLLRLRDARAVRDASTAPRSPSARAARRCCCRWSCESLNARAARARCRATSTSTAPPASTRRSPTRIASSASWPRASTSSIATDHDVVTNYAGRRSRSLPRRTAGRDTGRRADAQHPVVRRARARPSRRRWGTSTSGRCASMRRCRATARPGTSCASPAR